jgi:hypothetical protein
VKAREGKLARLNPSVCYETIRTRGREGFEIAGRSVESAEVFPNPEASGVDGFTFTVRQAAFAKMRKLP